MLSCFLWVESVPELGPCPCASESRLNLVGLACWGLSKGFLQLHEDRAIVLENSSVGWGWRLPPGRWGLGLESSVGILNMELT